MCTFYTLQEARPYPSRNFSCKKLKFSSKLTPGIPKMHLRELMTLSIKKPIFI